MVTHGSDRIKTRALALTVSVTSALNPGPLWPVSDARTIENADWVNRDVRCIISTER